MIFISDERKSKTRKLHGYYLQNYLSIMENLCNEVKLCIQIVTTLRLGEMYDFLSHFLTKIDEIFHFKRAVL